MPGVQRGWRREFFESYASNVAQAKGMLATFSETFIKGTAKIKKSNFSGHVKKAQHMQQRFCNLWKPTAAPQVPRQGTSVPYIQDIRARHQQISVGSFLGGKKQSFKFSEDMIMFEGHVLVD